MEGGEKVSIRVSIRGFRIPPGEEAAKAGTDPCALLRMPRNPTSPAHCQVLQVPSLLLLYAPSFRSGHRGLSPSGQFHFHSLSSGFPRKAWSFLTLLNARSSQVSP